MKIYEDVLFKTFLLPEVCKLLEDVKKAKHYYKISYPSLDPMCDALNTIRSYEQSKVIYDGFIRTCDELIFLLPIITKEEFDELSNLFKVCQIYVGKDKRQYFVFEENGKKYRVENRMIKKAYDEEYDVLEEYYVEPVNIVRGQNDFEKVLKNLYRKYSRKCINF